MAARLRAANLPVAMPGHGHDDDESDASGGKGQAGVGGGVTEKLLQELRLQDGGGVKHASDQHHEQEADREVLELEELEVHERGLVAPLPPDEAGDADDEHDAEGADEVRGEPIVLFAFVEHDLEAAHGEGEEAEADVVEFEEVPSVGLDPGRVLY